MCNCGTDICASLEGSLSRSHRSSSRTAPIAARAGSPGLASVAGSGDIWCRKIGVTVSAIGAGDATPSRLSAAALKEKFGDGAGTTAAIVVPTAAAVVAEVDALDSVALVEA